MKKCKSCQTEIDANAKKCPNCKIDQRNWFVRHKITSVLLGLILVAIIGSALGGSKNTTQPNSAEAPKTAQTAEKVTAAQIADDFDANQVAAEKKWGGKYVEFTAPVTNITETGIAFSNVGTKEFSMTQISCNTTDKNVLASLTNGQQATVRGTVGKQDFGVVGMNGCTVVK